MKTVLLLLILSVMYPGKRQVLLFYNEAGSQLRNKQVALLHEAGKDLAERDMEVHVYNTASAAAEVAKWNIKIASPFTGILIGKDGGEKLRWDSVITTDKLFGVIDAMPMRKEEMKRQNK